MKKLLCIGVQVVSTLLLVSWVYIFFVSHRLSQTKNISAMMILNIVFCIAVIILCCTYLDMSIDKLFSNYSSDVLPFKEKIFIAIELGITISCMTVFAFIILKHNIQMENLTSLDNIKIKILGLIVANAWILYASYQSYQIISKK